MLTQGAAASIHPRLTRITNISVDQFAVARHAAKSRRLPSPAPKASSHTLKTLSASSNTSRVPPSRLGSPVDAHLSVCKYDLSLFFASLPPQTAALAALHRDTHQKPKNPEKSSCKAGASVSRKDRVRGWNREAPHAIRTQLPPTRRAVGFYDPPSHLLTTRLPIKLRPSLAAEQIGGARAAL